MTLKFKKFSLKKLENEKALYSFAELKEYIEYEIRRIYFIQNCKQATGQHCHKIEEEMFVMAKGRCTAVIDRGSGKENILLEAPSDAIYVGSYVWHGFKDFSDDALLLALSSTNYSPDRNDYMEDYDEYKKITAGAEKL